MVAQYKHSQWMTNVAKLSGWNVSVPSQGFYSINRVEETYNVSLNK